MSRLRTSALSKRWFDVVIVSCELGVAKPSLKIYEATVAQMGPYARWTSSSSSQSTPRLTSCAPNLTTTVAH
jgi:hypothetical protein